MARRTPDPGLLIFALLSRDELWEARAIERLQQEFGTLFPRSEGHPFPWTHFYAEEVGETPIRRYIATTRLLPREELPEQKRWSISLEEQLSQGGARPVNIDAGCLTQGHLFLASTKDHKQRVYMGNGIYVEPTLFCEKGVWQGFPWSYPDFLSPHGILWLDESKQLLRKLIKEKSAQ